MFITKEELASQILKYMKREISLKDRVDWAEEAIREADFDERDIDILQDIIGRLGLADVREFGLTLDDCYEYLQKLGYTVSIMASKTA
jgi:hypothetical protein